MQIAYINEFQFFEAHSIRVAEQKKKENISK
jgi:hypothetical protein